ncbi:MAG: tetratricopeptide repeat protein [bacterium JZ-2024 1]
MRHLTWRSLMVVSFVLLGIQMVFSQEGGVQKAKEPKPIRTVPAVPLSTIMSELEQTYSQAVEVARGTLDVKIRVARFLSIAQSMKKAGERQKAITHLTQALEEASRIEEESKRAHALEDIVRAMGKMGLAEADLFNQAYQSAHNFRELFRYYLFSEIAEAMAKAGKAEENITILHNALQIPQNIHYGYYRGSALCSIAEEMAKAGERQKAVHLFKQALQDAQSTEEEHFRGRLLRRIVQAMAELDVAEEDLFRQAFHIALSIKDEPFRARLLSDIVDATTKLGLFPLSLEIIQTIEEEPPPSSAIFLTVKAMAKAGEKEEAVSLFTRALQIVSRIEDESSRESALNLVVLRMAKVGLAEMDLFNQALQIALSIKDEQKRFYSLRAIAISMAKTGERRKAGTILRQALQVARKIQEEWKRSLSVESAVSAMEEVHLTEAGLINQALQVALSIKDRSERTLALRSIALALARSGERQKALTVFKQAIQSAKDGEAGGALCSIAISMVQGDVFKEDLFHRILQVARQIEDKDYRAHSLLCISSNMGSEGFLSQAYTAAKSIEEPIRRLTALAEVVWHLRQATG